MYKHIHDVIFGGKKPNVMLRPKEKNFYMLSMEKDA